VVSRREADTGPTDTSAAERIDVQVPLADEHGQVVALFELAMPYAPIAASVAGDTRRLDIAMVICGLIILLLALPRIRQAGAAMRTVASQQHRELVRDLRGALLDGRQLRLEYQPLAHLRTGRVRAVEALLRWDHPRRGAVPPAEFIPQIEQTDLIWPLTVRVLELAIQQAVAWRAQRLDLRVSVNVAAPCLVDHRLSGTVAELLERSGLPADRLAIELTEESVMREPKAAADALLALRSLGIEVLALDDFGTGYSSLTRLRDLPISAIKIDRRFVTDAGAEGDPTLIAAIAELAHKFGLSVVAEGMEDEATWDRMAALGCDMGQGYWLSRPQRPEGVLDWMRRYTIEQWPQPHAALEIADARSRPERPKTATRRRRRPPVPEGALP
jgi:EAL domain-containing protein (putative c-di-GMP-specific phosphodiesterase class I)